MPEVHMDPAPRRAERWIVLSLVVGLVVWRSGVLVFWAQAHFDADQAVFGLMAKHLAEGRAFPVFMYGQSYILAVQAWMAAPLFALFGVSVTALKFPLLLINVAVAVLLVRLLEREAGVRPMLGAVAAAPFILPAPGTTAQLLEASGGNLETFLYVLLLWLTRRRPWICGLILGVGFLQREFAVYGLVALAGVWAIEGALATRAGWLRLGRMMLAAAGVWIAIQALRLVSSAAGPGTTIADLDGAPNNLLELAGRTCIAPGTLVNGAARLVTEHWPELLGTATYRLSDFSIESRMTQGAAWAWLLPAAVIGLALVRIAMADRSLNRRLATSICGYLVMVGSLSVAGYVVGRCGELSFYTMRYELLSIMAMVAIGGWFLRVERLVSVRGTWIALIVAWTLLAGTAHARLWREYLTAPPLAAKAEVAHRLDAEGVRYGRADYWMAYYVSFVTNERVILASTDFVRVRTYNRLVQQHAAEAVTITRTPCPGGREIVPRVYICRP
jgi:hypothetical protein